MDQKLRDNTDNFQAFFTDRSIDPAGDVQAPEPVKTRPPLSLENIADSAYVGTWEFVNSATYGLSSLALTSALGDTSFYESFSKNLQKKKSEHPFISNVSSFAGSIVPFIVPEEGLIYTALRAPVSIAEGLGETFTASSLAKNLLNPTVRKYFNASLQGAVYGGFGGLTSGLDIANMDGPGIDSISSAAAYTLSGAGLGAALGPAVQLVGDTVSYLSNKALNKTVESLNVPDLSKDGLDKLFLLAQSETQDPTTRSILQENQRIVSEAVSAVNKHVNDPLKNTIPEYTNSNTLLDLVLGQPDFSERVFSSSKPLKLKDLYASSNFVSNLKNKVSKEFGIDPERVSIRENLTQLISKNLREAGEVSDNLLNVGSPTINSFLNTYAEMPATNASLQRESVLSVYDSLINSLENYNTEDEVLNRALDSGFVSSKENFNLLNDSEKKSFFDNYLNIESSENTNSLINSYIKRTKAGILSLKTLLNPNQTNSLNQSELYQNLLKSIDVLNAGYREAQETIGRDAVLPSELTRLHAELRASLGKVSSKEDLWGKGAILRTQLFKTRNLKLQIKSDLDSLLKINPKKRDIPGIVYDDEGFAVSKPRLKTSLPFTKLNKYKTVGMAQANTGTGDLLPEYTLGYLNNIEKEFAVIQETLNTHEQTLESRLISETPGTSRYKELQDELLKVRESKIQVSKDTELLKVKKTNINEHLSDLRQFNDRRVQNWFNATDALAKVSQQAKNTSLNFEFHTGGPSPQVEVVRLLRDAAVGYYPGVERSLSWLFLSGLGAGLKYGANKTFGDVSPETTFLLNKTRFLEKRNFYNKFMRSKKIKPAQNVGNEKYSRLLKGAGMMYYTNMSAQEN